MNHPCYYWLYPVDSADIYFYRLADIGFDPEVNYQDDLTNVRLLVRLLVPAVLLITVMLQIHLFHKKFLQLTEPNNL